MRTLLSALAIAALGLASCTADNSSESTVQTEIAGTLTVRCGCTVEGVGACGNYVEVGDKVLPLAGEHGLGDHEFCGQESAQADIAGHIAGGEFVATTVSVKSAE